MKKKHVQGLDSGYIYLNMLCDKLFSSRGPPSKIDLGPKSSKRADIWSICWACDRTCDKIFSLTIMMYNGDTDRINRIIKSSQ